MAVYPQGVYGQQPGYQAFGQPTYIPIQQPVQPVQQVSPPVQTMQQPQQVQQNPQGVPAYAARAVMCREEAVAAEILDGRPWLFIDEQHGAVYRKRYNPYTNQIEFDDFYRGAQPQQAAPQFVPWELFQQYQQDVEQRFAAIQPQKRTTSKAEGSDGK